ISGQVATNVPRFGTSAIPETVSHQLRWNRGLDGVMGRFDRGTSHDSGLGLNALLPFTYPLNASTPTESGRAHQNPACSRRMSEFCSLQAQDDSKFFKVNSSLLAKLVRKRLRAP